MQLLVLLDRCLDLNNFSFCVFFVIELFWIFSRIDKLHGEGHQIVVHKGYSSSSYVFSV